MQERRTTIRKSHYARMQYCPSEDLELRDGRLADVSERGAGVLVRERHRSGELVTLGFSLPGTEDTLTATGVIRWSGSESPKGNWHRAGVEWLPLEDATRNRLHQFLDTAKPAPSRPAPTGAGSSIRRIALIVAAVATSLLGWSLYRWARAVETENAELVSTVQRRDAIINYLGQEGQRLKFELGEARRYLAETAGEVARLDVQAQLFGRQVQRLNQDVDRFQRSYLQASEERTQLMQKVLDLEQEKASLAKRLASVDELKLAIRDAIESRKQTQQAERLAMLKARGDAQERWLSQGNRGYLIRDGRPTVGHSTVWIRVHEPEAVSTPRPAAAGSP
jgi:hypothetical protein